MASLDFEHEGKVFGEFYRSQQALLNEATLKFRSLSSDILNEEIPGFDLLNIISILHRLKTHDECLSKFSRKYRAKLERSQTPYSIQDHITDLIGLRVVCLYEDEIDKIIERLTNSTNGFEMLEMTDKIAQIDSSEDQLGYRAKHLDLKLSPFQQNIPGCSRFGGLRFEVQIRTVIQDAWSSVDHKIKYKKDLPQNLRRRVSVLSGLFELADREFLAIRNERDVLSKAAQERVMRGEEVVQSEASPLNALELMSFLTLKFPEFNFSAKAVEELQKEIQLAQPQYTLDDLAKGFDALLEEVKRYQTDAEIALKPFTFLRHVLFLKDRAGFSKILYRKQGERFVKWLDEGLSK